MNQLEKIQLEQLKNNQIGAYQMDNRFKNSIILMGVDWSKAAKLKAVKDIAKEHPRIAECIGDLNVFYRKKLN